MAKSGDRFARPIVVPGRDRDAKPVTNEPFFETALAVDWGSDDGDATGITVMDKTLVLAELRYKLVDNSDWAAIVTKAEDPDESGFQLHFQQGRQFQKSGVFSNTKALVKFIRDKAAKKFPGITPVEDTLDRLQGRSAQSVVPDCYGSLLGTEARETRKCKKCPYQTECVEVALETDIKAQRESEPEELFLQRLRRKVADRWGEVRVLEDIRPAFPEGIPLAGTSVDEGKDFAALQCPHCNGTGQRVTDPDALAHDLRRSGDNDDCPHCNGTGMKPDPCEACGGTGSEMVPILVVHPAEEQQYRAVECGACLGTGEQSRGTGD